MKCFGIKIRDNDEQLQDKLEEVAIQLTKKQLKKMIKFMKDCYDNLEPNNHRHFDTFRKKKKFETDFAIYIEGETK